MAYEGTFVLASKMKGARRRGTTLARRARAGGAEVSIIEPELCQASPEPVFRIRRTSFVQDHPDQSRASSAPLGI